MRRRMLQGIESTFIWVCAMAKNGKPNGGANGFALPDAQSPVTREELEKAGQQRLRYKPFTDEEERGALDWWAMRLLQAETTTGNPEARKNPGKWVAKLKERLSDESRQDVMAEIVKDWHAAKATGTLDEPIWADKVSVPTRRGLGAVA